MLVFVMVKFWLADLMAGVQYYGEAIYLQMLCSLMFTADGYAQ
jgi:hypothetical protein